MKQSSVRFIAPPDEPREEEEPLAQSLRRYADSWISGLGAIPSYKINSIIVYLQAEHKHIKKVEMDVVKEKRHIQFKIHVGILTLIFGRRRGKIIDGVQSVMDDFAKGWTFNILFVRNK